MSGEDTRLPCDVDLNRDWWIANYKNVDDWDVGAHSAAGRTVLKLLRTHGSGAVYNYLAALQTTHSITELRLNGVDCEPETLARAVASMRELHTLDLQGCFVGWQYRLDEEKIFDTLDWLLTTRPSLRVLKLAWNGFTDSNMQPLADKFTHCALSWQPACFYVT